MMLVIPAIELIQGHCVRKIHGEPGTDGFYERMSLYPHELAQLWRIGDAKSIHIVDKDGLNGNDMSLNISAIEEIIATVDIPIQLITNFCDVEVCRQWLECGVFRIVISTLILDDPQGVEALIQEYTSSRVVVGIKAHNRIVDFAGEYPASRDIDFALKAQALGVNRIVYSDSHWEGTYFGPDIEVLTDVAQQTGMRVTALGGIDSPEELWQVHDLTRYGIDSVVIGRALFENKFPCQQIWRLVESECCNEVMPTSSSTALLKNPQG